MTSSPPAPPSVTVGCARRRPFRGRARAGGGRRGAGLVLLALLVAAPALLAPEPGRAQGIGEELGGLAADNGRLYLRPVARGVGAGMSSAWLESAAALDPLHVSFGVRAVGTVIPDEGDLFAPVLPDRVTVEELGGQAFEHPYGSGAGLVTPTATGRGPGISVEPRGALRDSLVARGLDPAEFALAFPRGFDIPAVPLAVLQGSVGLPAGTEATVRVIPGLEVDEDIGSLTSFGAGLKHEVSRWLGSAFPLDVAVAAGLQSFDAGDYLSARSRHAALVASKELGALTLFASGALEKADVDVTYTLENPRLPGAGTTVAFSEEEGNRSRLTTGFNLDLLFLRVGADYTFSRYNVVSAHLGLGF